MIRKVYSDRSQEPLNIKMQDFPRSKYVCLIKSTNTKRLEINPETDYTCRYKVFLIEKKLF